jgi:hypothetical protein
MAMGDSDGNESNACGLHRFRRLVSTITLQRSNKIGFATILDDHASALASHTLATPGAARIRQGSVPARNGRRKSHFANGKRQPRAASLNG